MASEITTKGIESRILTIRNQQVMIDRDLAELYGVETRILNQAVKRNIERFPENFMFQLTKEETEIWMSQKSNSNDIFSRSQIVILKSQFVISSNDFSRSQIATLKNDDNRGQNIKYLPYAFTEQGVAMLSGVLKSETAIQMSIQIMNAFVAMRHFLNSNAKVFTEIDSIKQHLLSSDIQQFNTQYPTLIVNHTSKMHDRFLIIDNKILYHIGASLKDLGKKCFAFEILDKALIPHLLANL